MLARLASLRSKVGSTESHPTRKPSGVATERGPWGVRETGGGGGRGKKRAAGSRRPGRAAARRVHEFRSLDHQQHAPALAVVRWRIACEYP